MTSFGSEFEHERLEIFHDPATGIRGAIAVHSTALGPSMGGLRLHSYASVDEAATDALRLAHAMSLKNAAAGLDLGGGKAVLIDDGGWSDPIVRAARMEAFGRIVEQLGGRYVTAEDVGTTPQDMDAIARATSWVAGRPVDQGGRGDPSPTTARTVFGAIGVAARHRLGRADLTDVRVGVQGVGHVGAALVGLLTAAGADVVLADAVPERAADIAERHGATAVPSADFPYGAFDIFAPCALGLGLTVDDVPQLRCSAIAGAANNPLSDPAVAYELAGRNILYVPDFLANCGGIIDVGAEVLGFDDAEVERLVADAIARTDDVLTRAHDAARLPIDVAREYAESRIAAAAGRDLGTVVG